MVVQGKLIINVSSNTGHQGAVANGRTLQAPASTHRRTPSVLSAVSSNTGSISTNRNSIAVTSSPVQSTVTPVAASPTVPAATPNGGRQLSPYEDEHGPLPAKYVSLEINALQNAESHISVGILYSRHWLTVCSLSLLFSLFPPHCVAFSYE